MNKPSALPRLVTGMPVRKMIVARFEEPVVDTIGLRVRGRIRAKEDSIPVFQEKSSRCVGLTSQFRDTSTDIDVIVGQPVQHFADVSKVLGITSDVCADEGRGGMAGNQIFEAAHQAVESRKFRSREAPLWSTAQLIESFIGLVYRLKKSGGIAHVDQ